MAKIKDAKRKNRGQKVRTRLCRRLSLAFEASPYNASELAAKVGVDVSSVSCWMSAKAWPGLNVIEDLSRALGVTPGWYWGNEPPPQWDPPMPRPR